MAFFIVGIFYYIFGYVRPDGIEGQPRVEPADRFGRCCMLEPSVLWSAEGEICGEWAFHPEKCGPPDGGRVRQEVFSGGQAAGKEKNT
jgi:hypothetical protein